MFKGGFHLKENQTFVANMGRDLLSRKGRCFQTAVSSSGVRLEICILQVEDNCKETLST
jgi:hypothetical protein